MKTNWEFARISEIEKRLKSIAIDRINFYLDHTQDSHSLYHIMSGIMDMYNSLIEDMKEEDEGDGSADNPQ